MRPCLTALRAQLWWLETPSVLSILRSLFAVHVHSFGLAGVKLVHVSLLNTAATQAGTK